MNVEYHFNLFTKLGARHAVERWTMKNRVSFGFIASSHKDCNCVDHVDSQCEPCTCTSCCYFDGNNPYEHLGMKFNMTRKAIYHIFQVICSSSSMKDIFTSCYTRQPNKSDYKKYKKTIDVLLDVLDLDIRLKTDSIVSLRDSIDKFLQTKQSILAKYRYFNKHDLISEMLQIHQTYDHNTLDESFDLIVKTCESMCASKEQRLMEAEDIRLPLIKHRTNKRKLHDTFGDIPTCVICYDSYDDHYELEFIACKTCVDSDGKYKALYHTECMNKWRKHDNQICGLCRRSELIVIT